MKITRLLSGFLIAGSLLASLTLAGCGNNEVDKSTVDAAPPPAPDAKPAPGRPANKPTPPAGDSPTSTGNSSASQAAPAGK